ncbi:hypothetical protein [Streptomyces sp. NPDC088739]|uniref:hypothetical protein n=1 Tax=Streptomyces sp. NPDC088739 TaxID=3365882 RepID=UPI00380E92CC
MNEDLDPFVSIHLDQKQVGQWTTADARPHALFVMETIEAARLDTAYLRHLVDVLGLDLNTATAMINDLARFRPNTDHAETTERQP